MNPFIVAAIIIETIAIIWALADFSNEFNLWGRFKNAFYSAFGVFIVSNIVMWGVFVVGFIIASILRWSLSLW